MDFKSLLSSLDQLSEATEKTKTGLKHTAEPGGYGRKDDEDEEGNKVKADAPKRGRGRPKKDADASGEVKKYDFSAFGVKHGKDIKLPKHDKDKTTKHSLKEYFDDLDKALNEAEQVTMEPAKQNTQVIKQGTKTLGTVSNPQLAAQIKQSIGKGEMSLAGDQVGQEMAEDGDYSAKKARAGKDIGKPGKNFAKIAKKAGEKYGSEESGKKVAGAILAKLRKGVSEAERPSADSTMGAGLGAGRSQGVLEGAKPDYIDLDKDGNKKESMKKAAQDKKKKVKEGLAQNLLAAKLAGKAHGLKGHSHCGKNYEDMEEARMYHEGYKEGLDECYGMGGMMEDSIPATVPGMADAAEPAMDEGNAFTGALNRTPAGGKFSVGGKTFTDRSSIEESPFAFEAWDNQLNSLLESKEQVNEGMTVSISKGQQGAPDSVTVSAQDAEADQLLAAIKQAGLGLFGGDEAGQVQHSANPMTVDTTDPAEVGTGGVAIDVVDDHDGMMNLIKKVVGAEPKGPEGGFADQEGGEEGQDYEEEGGEHHDHEHTDEGACNECGMMECGCDTMEEDEEEIGGPSDESQEEYMDQAEEEVAEAEEVVNNNDEAEEEQSDATRDAALAQAADNNEEQVDEGEYANSDDDQFAADIDFMTNVISGGLNKKKSTGQTTIPVIAGQEDRMTTTESMVADWKKLAGI